jgi:hypothetical protein
VAKGEQVSLSSPQLGAQEVTNLGGGPLTFVKGSGLKPGTEVFLKISSPALTDHRLPLLIGTAVGLALIFATIAFAVRPGKTRTPATSQLSRDEILDQIAALDDQFEAGSIEEGEYRRRREFLKNQL